MRFCVVCGKLLDSGIKHECPKKVLAAKDGAQRKANNEELYLSYDVPKRNYNTRIREGFFMMGE